MVMCVYMNATTAIRGDMPHATWIVLIFCALFRLNLLVAFVSSASNEQGKRFNETYI